MSNKVKTIESAEGHGKRDNAAAISALLGAATPALQPEQLEQVIAPTIRRVVAEYSVVLREQIERQVFQQPEPAAPPAQVPESDAMTEMAGAAAALQQTIIRIRAHFLRLADIEVRRIMDTALGLQSAEPVQRLAPAAPAPAPATSPPPAQQTDPVVVFTDEDTLVMDIEEATPADGADLYEGRVRLTVNAEGQLQRVVQFVDDLCQRPEFRLMRMAGSPQQHGAEIWLALREPLPFKQMLLEMESVSGVSSPVDAPADGRERQVSVTLSAGATAQ